MKGDIEKIPAVVVKELGGVKIILTVEWDVHYSPVQEWSDQENMKKVEEFEAGIMDSARLNPSDKNIINIVHGFIGATPIISFGDRQVDLCATEGSWGFIPRRNRSTTGSENTQNSTSKSTTGLMFGPLQHTEDSGEEISENNTSAVKSLQNEMEERVV